MSNMQRVQVQLTDEQLAALRERASGTERPVAALIREAVDAWLGVDERRRRIERALVAIGGFHSGLGDLAEKHDEYFAEAIEERVRR
jgi:Arc/MetJ-type ribon-helix-helix transcriptional regulator